MILELPASSLWKLLFGVSSGAASRKFSFATIPRANKVKILSPGKKRVLDIELVNSILCAYQTELSDINIKYGLLISGESIGTDNSENQLPALNLNSNLQRSFLKAFL